MQIYNLPDDFSTEAEKGSPVIIRAYESRQSSVNNKSIMNQNMIDILLSGRKTITEAYKLTSLEAGELMILPKGNCIVSQAVPENGYFRNIALYFTNEVFEDFLIRYDSAGYGATNDGPFLVYKQDGFINNYIESLRILMQSPYAWTREVKRHKLDELLLYLFHQNPQKFASLNISAKDDEDMRIRKAVESNIGNPVTVEELAFLCNTSLSSFKRRFLKLYEMAPKRWLLQKKMELAATFLRHPGEHPGVVFEKVGYESHSSFIEAFKKHHGLTPKEYRNKYLSF